MACSPPETPPPPDFGLPASQIAGNTRSNDAYAWLGHGSGSTAYVNNGLNQVTSVGGIVTAHDAKGNMTGDGLGRTFGYSSENLLTSASGGVSLSYDPLLRLHQVAGNPLLKFGYDGLDMIVEHDASNGLLRRYVHGPGVDEPLVWYEGAGTSDKRWFHADERGSVIAVSNSAGNVMAINAYDEYGSPADPTFGRFQYTGQIYLKDIGLSYYKARMYHPKLGRFMQTDPIGYWGGMNLYNYVRSDPVNFVDPLGLAPEDDLFCLINPQDCIIVTGSRIVRTPENTGLAALPRSGFGDGPTTYAPPGTDGGGGGSINETAEERRERLAKEEAERRARNQYCASLRLDAARESLISNTVIGGGALAIAARRFGERFGPVGFGVSVAGSALYSFATATDGDPTCQ